jgi:hypothetical protein
MENEDEKVPAEWPQVMFILGVGFMITLVILAAMFTFLLLTGTIAF